MSAPDAMARKVVLTAPTGIAALRFAESPVPAPGPGQVLVRMRAASLNFRDILIVNGLYSATLPPDLVPLSDGAGEVVRVGEGPSRWQVGHRVCGIFTQTWLGGRRTVADFAQELGGSVDGVLSQYRVFDEEALVSIPRHLSFEEAATLPCAAVTAWNALFAGRPVRAGEDVLVMGTGGVSSFALQFAKAAGARVIAISSSDEKLDGLRRMGADHGINYTKFPEWQDEVRRATEGRGVDHVVEIGGPGTVDRSLGSVALGGQVHLIGVLTQGTLDPIRVLTSAAIVRGILVGSREMFEDMNRAIEAHGIRPMIGARFEFDQTPEAYAMIQGAGHTGKIVIAIP